MPNEKSSSINSKFVGERPLQFAIWAHSMSYGAALLCIMMGGLTLFWSHLHYKYQCEIDGFSISNKYFNQTILSTGKYSDCSNFVEVEERGFYKPPKLVCCYPDRQQNFFFTASENYVGSVYSFYGLLLLLLENTNWGYGLYYPADTFLYRYRISLCSIFNLAVAGYGFTIPITTGPAFTLLLLAIIQAYTVYRQEAGDGGRSSRLKQSICHQIQQYFIQKWSSWTKFCQHFHCGQFFVPDRLSKYTWLILYLTINGIYFVVVLLQWYQNIFTIRQSLLQGTLPLSKSTTLEHMYRKAVRYGPPTYYLAYAKAFGGCLNMNCAFQILPVSKYLIQKLSNFGASLVQDSYIHKKKNPDYHTWMIPFTYFIPLSQNIIFHKLCSWMILIQTIGHIIAHYCNLIYATPATLSLFRDMKNPSYIILKWEYGVILTGWILVLAMFIIYTGAMDSVKAAKYEIFLFCHLFFILFYIFFLLHGPYTFFWMIIPLSLYIYDRYLQSKRGKIPYILCKVDYVAPVMTVYYRPRNKSDFSFKEGQYIYMNVPHVSAHEWHPFTISSCVEDLTDGPRVDLLTGEEVIKVPRPLNLAPEIKWNKYCHVSENWRKMDPNKFLDKSETGYFDYITCHIRIHGSETGPATTWTRRVKEYFQQLQLHYQTERENYPPYLMTAGGQRSSDRILNTSSTAANSTRNFSLPPNHSLLIISEECKLETVSPTTPNTPPPIPVINTSTTTTATTTSTTSPVSPNSKLKLDHVYMNIQSPQSSNPIHHKSIRPQSTSGFPLYLYEYDSHQEISIGRHLDPDNQPIIRIDGPYTAPSEYYLMHDTVMLIGSGIGLTPCSSILSACLKYRWKQKKSPERLYFYWLLKQSEVDTFQWFIHRLTEICFDLKSNKESKLIDANTHCEIHIYVTSCTKDPLPVPPLQRHTRPLAYEAKARGVRPPSFTANQLYETMLNPSIDSTNQIEKMRVPDPENRLQNVWVWRNRPYWDDIFEYIKEFHIHPDIGVCFCGSPVLADDIYSMCKKYSNVRDGVTFTLHKENF